MEIHFTVVNIILFFRTVAKWERIVNDLVWSDMLKFRDSGNYVMLCNEWILDTGMQEPLRGDRGLAEWMLACFPYGQHREMDLTETRVEQTSAQTPAWPHTSCMALGHFPHLSGRLLPSSIAVRIRWDGMGETSQAGSDMSWALSKS